MKEELTQEHLKEIVHYNQDTGIFTWLERSIQMFQPGKYQLRACNTWNTRYACQQAGSIKAENKSKTSYINVRITLNGKKNRYKAHRLVFLYLEGHFPLEDVDHVDGNGLNNRRNNLRES